MELPGSPDPDEKQKRTKVITQEEATNKYNSAVEKYRISGGPSGRGGGIPIERDSINAPTQKRTIHQVDADDELDDGEPNSELNDEDIHGSELRLPTRFQRSVLSNYPSIETTGVFLYISITDGIPSIVEAPEEFNINVKEALTTFFN
jgi:hypothetical protein